MALVVKTAPTLTSEARLQGHLTPNTNLHRPVLWPTLE